MRGLAPLVLAAVALFPGAGQASAKNPTLYIRALVTGESSAALSGAAELVEARLTAAIEREFPCARVFSSYGVTRTLAAERKCQAVGVNCGLLGNTAEAFAIMDYLLTVRLTVAADRLLSTPILVTMTFDRRNRQLQIFDRLDGGQLGDAAALADRLADGAVQDLGKYQLCPYTGRLSLYVHTEGTKVDEPQHYSVFCNGHEEQYRRSGRDERYATTSWKLDKVGRFQAVAEIDYVYGAERRIDEEDGCHTCKSGRQGGRTSRLRRSEAMVNSGFTSTRGARVALDFGKPGVYAIGIESYSSPGYHSVRSEETVEGTCDLPPGPPVVNSPRRQVTVPLVGWSTTQPGGPLDKRLSGESRSERAGDFPDQNIIYVLKWDLKRD